MIKIALLVLFIHSALATESKYTVCTITINSSDEAAVFKKNLNPAHFNFIELVSEDTNWADKSCNQNTQCDILVISGHFGGEFFSDTSPLRLPLYQMEKLACLQGCYGIYKQPLEVFLFGCNTLSTKNSDHRSPEQYYQVLRSDGFSPLQAQNVVESRYGILGHDFSTRMSNVFSNSLRIYGFQSTSPVGKSLAPKLEKYFKQIPDYRAHLENLETKRLVKEIDYANQMISQSINLSSFNQCSGSEISQSNDELKMFCNLIDPNISVGNKKSLIEDQLTSGNYLKLIPMLVEVTQHQLLSQNIVLDAIGDNLVLKEQVLNIIERIKNSPLAISYASFAKSLNWISNNDFLKLIKSYVKSESSPPIDLEKADRICSLPKNVRDSIQPDDLGSMNSILSTKYGTRIINCLGWKSNQDHLKVVTQIILNTKDDDHKKELIWSTQTSAQVLMFSDNETLRKDSIERNEMQKIINKEIINLVNKRHDLSSIIYSFSPGKNLSQEEIQFVTSTINKGPDHYPGWQFLWLIRVAIRSSLKVPSIMETLKTNKAHPRAQSAIIEYEQFYKSK